MNGFSKLTLSAALAGHEIDSLSEAMRFLDRLDRSKQQHPHWLMARQALLAAGQYKGAENLAWREFREALMVEGWLAP